MTLCVVSSACGWLYDVNLATFNFEKSKGSLMLKEKKN